MVRCSLSVVRRLLSVGSDVGRGLLFVVRCGGELSLFVGRCSLFVACCFVFGLCCRLSLFVVRCLLFVVCCLLFVVVG